MRIPELLNTREAAKLLRVKEQTIRKMRHQGKIAFVKVGSRTFHTEDQIFECM